LTEAQAELLRKYTTTVFLLYDSDRAGLTATFRAGDVLLRQGLKVHVVTLPEGEDPDTFVLRHGREKLEAQLADAIDVFERKVQILQRGGWFSDLRRKRVALDRLLPTIRSSADPIAYGLYVARAAEVAGIGEDALRRELREPVRAKHPETKTVVRVAKTTEVVPKVTWDSGASAEIWLVHLLLSQRPFIEAAAEHVDSRMFRDARLRAIFSQLIRLPSQVVIGSAISELPQHAMELAEYFLSLPAMRNPRPVLDDCVRTLKRREIGELLDDIERELPLAGDIEKNEILRRQRGLRVDLAALGGNRWKKFRYQRSS
jgi:DNA primase